MEQIKKWYRSIPLWLGFFLMILIALLFAGAATQITADTAYQTTLDIRNKYSTANVLYAKINVSKLTLALAKENCEVNSMQEHADNLESYFISLIGGGKHE